MLIIQWFCTVGKYNLVDKKSNYCSTNIQSLVGCLCKLAEKRAFKYNITKHSSTRLAIFLVVVKHKFYTYGTPEKKVKKL